MEANPVRTGYKRERKTRTKPTSLQAGDVSTSIFAVLLGRLQILYYPAEKKQTGEGGRLLETLLGTSAVRSQATGAAHCAPPCLLSPVLRSKRVPDLK